jgi:acyl-CoA thioester hydrolase
MTETSKPSPRARKPAARRKRAAPAADSPQLPVETVPASLIRVPLSVRWRDLDAFNHVNNSKFLSYLEEARLRWMMSLPGEWIDDNVAPVVAAAHVNYRRPIEWPNDIVVELFVERLGTTSLTIGHRIVSAQNDKVLYADGNVVMVWIGKQDGQAAALPDIVREACAGH